MSHEIARNWRLQKYRYGLMGEVCPHCEVKIFPPRDVCPSCRGGAKVEYQFSGRGEVYSYTKVFDAPEGFGGLAPYYCALVKLEEGPIITAQLTDVDPDELKIGMQVEMVTRLLNKPSQGEKDKGPLIYGYKFRPVLVRT